MPSRNYAEQLRQAAGFPLNDGRLLGIVARQEVAGPYSTEGGRP
jgi:hypothetical protein